MHGWLVGDPERRVLIEANAVGLLVRVMDPAHESVTETIGIDEDPSGAVWRAITRMARDAGSSNGE